MTKATACNKSISKCIWFSQLVNTAPVFQERRSKNRTVLAPPISLAIIDIG